MFLNYQETILIYRTCKSKAAFQILIFNLAKKLLLSPQISKSCLPEIYTQITFEPLVDGSILPYYQSSENPYNAANAAPITNFTDLLLSQQIEYTDFLSSSSNHSLDQLPATPETFIDQPSTSGGCPQNQDFLYAPSKNIPLLPEFCMEQSDISNADSKPRARTSGITKKTKDISKKEDIRRRNTESAQRCRKRRAEELAALKARCASAEDKAAALEKQVEYLTNLLELKNK